VCVVRVVSCGGGNTRMTFCCFFFFSGGHGEELHRVRAGQRSLRSRHLQVLAPVSRVCVCVTLMVVFLAEQ
jgi:hypothetical protein